MEYVVWNNEFGDFDMERCSPRGTVKSRMASGEERHHHRIASNTTRARTIRGPGKVGEQVVFIPTGSFVVAT